jgi:hypothetical protein
VQRLYLEGGGIDLGILRDLFPERPDSEFWFGEDAEGSYMVSRAVSRIAEPGDMYRAGKRILVRAVGLGRILDSGVRSVTLSGTYIDEHGHRGHVVAGVPAEMRIRAGRPQILINGEPVPNPDPLGPPIAALAEGHPIVAEVLDLIGTSDQLGWVDLYKVYEIIRDEAGRIGEVASKGWASRLEQSAFTASANRKDVSGDAARHARSTSPEPPKQVMTLHEGQHFIRRLARVWLESLTQPDR